MFIYSLLCILHRIEYFNRRHKRRKVTFPRVSSAVISTWIPCRYLLKTDSKLPSKSSRSPSVKTCAFEQKIWIERSPKVVRVFLKQFYKIKFIRNIWCSVVDFIGCILVIFCHRLWIFVVFSYFRQANLFSFIFISLLFSPNPNTI